MTGVQLPCTSRPEPLTWIARVPDVQISDLGALRATDTDDLAFVHGPSSATSDGECEGFDWCASSFGYGVVELAIRVQYRAWCSLIRRLRRMARALVGSHDGSDCITDVHCSVAELSSQSTCCTNALRGSTYVVEHRRLSVRPWTLDALRKQQRASAGVPALAPEGDAQISLVSMHPRERVANVQHQQSVLSSHAFMLEVLSCKI